MNVLKTTEEMKHTICLAPPVWTMTAIVAAAIIAFPPVTWSQTAEWTVYNTANSGLPYNGITALAIDAQGTIWIGTGRWYALAGGGLVKYDGQNWTVYNTANSGLPNNDHVGLSIDAQGNIWSATENGLAKFDGVNWSVYKTHNSGLPDNQVCAVAFDTEGNRWIATGKGLVKYDDVNWTVYNTSNSGLPNNFVWPIEFDDHGNLWIGTFGGGLAKFDGQNWTVYNTANSGLPDNTIAFFTFDMQDNLWIGTYGGVAKFDGQNWTVYNTGNSALPHNRVWNLAVDPQGNVWAATDGGLARFEGTSWTVYNTYNSSLPDNKVYSLAFDYEGNLWIGTENGGLAMFRQLPVVDFNSDGIVDIKDLLRLIESWGQDDPTVDIAPLFGDGIVDVLDLEVLMSHWLQEVIDPALIAHWKLDETDGDTAHDSIKDNDGIGPPDLLWRPEDGKIGGALELDGIDDSIVSTFSLNPVQTSFSAFAWIKGGGPNQVVLSQSDGVDWLLIDENGNFMTALRRGHYAPTLTSGYVITDGDWHHIGVVWDGSHRYLFADGIAVAEDTANIGYLSASNGNLCIGCGNAFDAGSFFSGLIDDVRIYNIALSDEKIAALTQ